MSQLNIDNIANQLGTGGPDFAGMPTVGGDPVIESGSNTDGEWIRWADGTQTCSRRAITFGTRSGQRVSRDWNYPTVFVSAGPVHVGHTVNLNSVFVEGWDLSAIYCPTAEAGNPTDAKLHMTVSGQDTSIGWSNINTYAHATGRWK